MAEDLNRELRTRLGATKAMLKRLSAPARATMSEMQAAAFRSSVTSLTTAMSETDAADLSSLASGVGFTEDDLASVVESLKAATKNKTVQKERKPRKVMQDFSTVFGYFTDAEWKAMQDEAERPNEVRSILFGRMLALGVKAPSEGTKRLLTAAMLMLTENMRLPIRLQK